MNFPWKLLRINRKFKKKEERKLDYGKTADRTTTMQAGVVKEVENEIFIFFHIISSTHTFILIIEICYPEDNILENVEIIAEAENDNKKYH